MKWGAMVRSFKLFSPLSPFAQKLVFPSLETSDATSTFSDSSEESTLNEEPCEEPYKNKAQQENPFLLRWRRLTRSSTLTLVPMRIVNDDNALESCECLEEVSVRDEGVEIGLCPVYVAKHRTYPRSSIKQGMDLPFLSP